MFIPPAGRRRRNTSLPPVFKLQPSHAPSPRSSLCIPHATPLKTVSKKRTTFLTPTMRVFFALTPDRFILASNNEEEEN
ncbi:hypothetical protein E2C01_037034 [Portunus trituberculatus]|uniref:Uncharacterized protein n=1 Tax=Portunus trituberculatus TaxID=210409 RepID=A0A5B7FDP5_PORTR|nr:hypothetical protein [Portunus trituberculatus]